MAEWECSVCGYVHEGDEAPEKCLVRNHPQAYFEYLILHVLLHDQKYQKSSKRFPLRNLPVSSRFAKARTICTLLCEHIE